MKMINIYSSFVRITEWNENGEKKKMDANIVFYNNEWMNERMRKMKKMKQLEWNCEM